MKILKQMIVFLGITMVHSSVFAKPTVHTWHQVTALSGNWRTTISMISETDKGYFEDINGNPISTFNVNAENPQRFGFGVYEGADFDIAYTVTVTEISAAKFISPTCVFVVTASAPATPDITINRYNNASCDVGHALGEATDFIVGN